MIESAEFEANPRLSLKEIYSITYPQLDAVIKLTQLEIIQSMATDLDEDDRVENGMLIRPDGAYPIPTEMEVEQARSNLEKIETGIRSKLRVGYHISVEELRKITTALESEENYRLNEEAAGREYYGHEAPFASDHRSVPDFLEAAQAMSILLGKPVTVWINKYRSEKETINPDTDIEELIARARRKDREDCASILKSTAYRDEEKSYHSLEKVEEWYK